VNVPELDDELQVGLRLETEIWKGLTAPEAFRAEKVAAPSDLLSSSDVLQNAPNRPQIHLNVCASRSSEAISARETKVIANGEDAERRSYESTVKKTEIFEIQPTIAQ
jgi:hypothetical protein